MKGKQQLQKLERLPSRPKGYGEFLSRLSSLIDEGRRTAARQVNTVLIATYWFMGQRIVQFEQQGKLRAGYGEALLKRLSADLSVKHGKGFSKRNLEMMRKFYLLYPITQTVSAQLMKRVGAFEQNRNLLILRQIGKMFPLSWSHYTLLMKLETPEKRTFYESLSLKDHWSVRQLERQVQSMLYERTALSKRKRVVLEKASEKPIVIRPEDEIKDSYVLDFLGLRNEYSESDLEDALIEHLQHFLLELGLGFAFVGRQKRFVLDGYEYKMDLVLYHIPLEAYVIIDLKIGRFSHENAGQMNLYLNWTKENLYPLAKNPPIGIVLCADKDSACAKYSTAGMQNKIFVSKYQLQLPDPDDLQRELERGRELFLKQRVGRRGAGGKSGSSFAKSVFGESKKS